MIATGTGGVTKTGPGTLTLSNSANSYTGSTTVSGGTLRLGGNNVLPATAVSLGAGTLDVVNFSDTVSSLTVTDGTLALATTGGGVGGSLTTTGSLTLAGNDTLAVNFTSAPTQATYSLLTYQGTRSGTFDTLTLTGSAAANSFVITYGGASNGTVGLQQRANQAATFTMTAAASRALVNTNVALSGTLSNTSFSGAVPLAISGSSAGQMTVAGLTTGSTIAGAANGTISGTIQTGGTAGQRTWSVVNNDAAAITTAATASGTLTVVDQRTFQVGTGTIALGGYLRGVATTSGSTTVSSSGLLATTASGTLGAFSSVGGFSLGLTSGSSAFNGASASQSTTYTLSGSAAAAGVISGTFSSTVAAELGSIPAVTVALTGTAFDAASVTKNQNVPIGSGGTVSVSNASGSFRSAAFVGSSSTVGTGWSVSGIGSGSSAAAGATLAGTASFNGTGLLSGIYTGTFSATFQNNQSLAGAAVGDVGSFSWNLSTNYVNTSGSGGRSLAASVPLASVWLASGTGSNANVASFAAGTTGSASLVSMVFTAPTEANLLSDVLNLAGTAGVAQVLQLSYDPMALGALAEKDLFLSWFDPSTSKWVNAVAGNSTNNVTRVSPFLGSWDDYVLANPGSAPANSLGAYGVDTANKRVWAAVDHNSQFAVVPEPSTIVLLGSAVGVAVATIARRRSRVLAA